jgi:hypothetical protein
MKFELRMVGKNKCSVKSVAQELKKFTFLSVYFEKRYLYRASLQNI